MNRVRIDIDWRNCICVSLDIEYSVLNHQIKIATNKQTKFKEIADSFATYLYSCFI